MENNRLNDTIRSIREWTRILEEAQAELDSLKDTVKAEMAERGTDTLMGADWKVTWKAVTSSRFDSKAFKADHADLYAVYVKPSVSRRFCLT